MELHKKFKTKKDLHKYMTHSRKCIYFFETTKTHLTTNSFSVKVWLPEFGHCRLSFMQKVLTDEKKSL